jgi:hypothetical protein
MFKLIFMILFWSCAALGAVYGFALITDDYVLQNKILFICKNIITSVSQWWQHFTIAVKNFLSSIQRTLQQFSPSNININDLAKKIKIPTQ